MQTRIPNVEKCWAEREWACEKRRKIFESRAHKKQRKTSVTLTQNTNKSIYKETFYISRHIHTTRRLSFALFEQEDSRQEISLSIIYPRKMKSYSATWRHTSHSNNSHEKRNNSKLTSQHTPNVKAFHCRKLIIIMREDNLWQAA